MTTFDGFDRGTETVAADGTTTSTHYEPRETTSTDARGVLTRRGYDAFGELTFVSRNPGGDPGHAAEHSFVRDGRGEIVSVTDSDGNVRRIARDRGGRIRHVTLPTAAGATPARFSMCHDVADKLVRLESPAGRVVTIAHDELGRTLSTSATDATGLTVETSQIYDVGAAGGLGLGRLTSKSDESGVYDLTYDSYGRSKNLTFAPSDRAIGGATNVAASYGATFTYSPAGLLKFVSFAGLPAVASLSYGHDARGRVRSVVAEAPAKVPYTTLVADVVHDSQDRITSARYSNGTSAAWTFNPLSERLDKIAYLDSAGAVLAGIDYVYDPSGNPTQEHREKAGVGFVSQKFHSYDPLDRLQTTDSYVPSGHHAETYVFTGGGNLLSAGDDYYNYDSTVTTQAASFVYDIWGQFERTLSYDPDGYLATDHKARAADGSHSTRTLQFDPTGCMRSITREDLSAEGTTTTAASEYTCGLDGRVVARDTTRPDGSRSRRIDFAGLAEIRPDEGIFMLRVPVGGTVSVEDARSLSTGARVAAMSGYLVSDARGSVLATTGFHSSAPDFTHEAEYDAWGKKFDGFSALSSPRHGFVGAEADEAVGTYSFGARTYDPSLRRWVSPDALLAALPSLDESIGDDLNLYAYAGNSPVRRIDLTGYWGEDFRAQLERIATMTAGFTYGFIQGAVPGGMLTTLAPAGANPAQGHPHEATFRHGQGGGQIIGGGVGVAAGFVGAAGGGALAATGGGALPGAVIAVGSSAAVANGTLAIAAGPKTIAAAHATGEAAPQSRPANEPAQGGGAKAEQATRGKGDPKHNQEQSALINMAKVDKKAGIMPADAKAYKELGKHAGVPVRGPEVHPSRPHGKQPHIHVGPVDHVPVKR